MMSLTFGLFTQVSGSGPFRPSCFLYTCMSMKCIGIIVCIDVLGILVCVEVH